jgi:hypothetical protein
MYAALLGLHFRQISVKLIERAADALAQRIEEGGEGGDFFFRRVDRAVLSQLMDGLHLR